MILDLHIPGTDGFKLCKLIRAQAGYEEVPILFLTGSKEDADYRKNFKAGGTASLTKPVSSFPSRRSTSRPGAATSAYS